VCPGGWGVQGKLQQQLRVRWAVARHLAADEEEKVGPCQGRVRCLVPCQLTFIMHQ
jgi:hypothetical protein